jgi:hypothetical protein
MYNLEKLPAALTFIQNFMNIRPAIISLLNTYIHRFFEVGFDCVRLGYVKLG